MTSRSKPFAHHLERLEDRTVPVQFGTPWTDGTNVKLSFVPDGTDVNGAPSNLFQTFQITGLSDQAWQNEVIRAFTAWTNLTNLNVGTIRDGGLPIGTPGPSQGDNRFGDVRIVARPLSDNVLAITVPPGYIGGTRVGDIILNSAKTFSIGGANGSYDLFSVMLQECGHALGVANSDNPASAMYEQYLGVRTGLMSDDVAAIKALYGSSRAPDALEITSTGSSGSGSSGSGSSGSGSTTATTTNNSFSGAYEVKYANVADEVAQRSLVVRADITTNNDVDYYKFKTPLVNNGPGITVQVATDGLSFLAPRLSVYNKYQMLVGTVQTTNPLQGQLSIFLPNGSFTPNTNYYVRVDSGAAGNLCKIGSYQLRLVFDPLAGDIASLGVQILDDLHINDALNNATLLQTAAGFAQSTRYKALAKLRDATDIDFYKFESPQFEWDDSRTMTVSVRAVDALSGLVPHVSLYDRNQNPITDAHVLVNDDGTYTIQLPDAESVVDYYIGVAAVAVNGLPGTGAYQLDIDFLSDLVKLDEFASGTLTDSERTDYRTLESNRSQVFHFLLSAVGGPAGQSGARLTIHDKYGAVVFVLFAKSGQTVSGVTPLDQGLFTMRIQGLTSVSGAALPDLAYCLTGASLDDPIGPDPADPDGSYNCDEDPPEYYEGQDLEDPPGDPGW